MNYLLSDKNTLVWLIFTIYAVTALFIVPSTINYKSQAQIVSADNCDATAIRFASRFMMRIALIFPMLLIFKNTI